MRTWTLQEFKDKIELEHDLQEESFISDAEMINYINEGIDWAEASVIGLYEDYYLTRTEWLPLESEVSLPTDIYANKLRKVEVATDASGISATTITRNANLDNNRTGYSVFHRSGEAPVLAFENLHGQMTHYRLTYTRNANRVVNGADIIDLPEVANYSAMQFVKFRCLQKEKDPMSFQSSQEVGGMKVEMENALANFVNDGSDQLQADMSFYNDFDSEHSYYF
jgi:hypothetical protein